MRVSLVSATTLRAPALFGFLASELRKTLTTSFCHKTNSHIEFPSIATIPRVVGYLNW